MQVQTGLVNQAIPVSFFRNIMQGTPIWDFDVQFYDFKKLAIADRMKFKEAIIKAEEQISDLFNERRRACIQQQKSFAYEGILPKVPNGSRCYRQSSKGFLCI